MQRQFALIENDFFVELEPGPAIWYSQSGTYMPYRRIEYAIETKLWQNLISINPNSQRMGTLVESVAWGTSAISKMHVNSLEQTRSKWITLYDLSLHNYT
jgi:hypothetical protein